MSEPASTADVVFSPDDIEPEDPSDDPGEFDGPTDVQGGGIEDDSGFLEDVSVFTHHDDPAAGPLGTPDESAGGTQ